MMRLAQLVIVTLLSLGSAAAARAGDLDGEMGRIFGSMSNTTDPGIHMGQRRGVITGGALHQRNRVMTPNLMAFRPPSIEAGCGGIDMYGGALSFISAEQFTAYMKAMAANALGYSFQLGLKSMCGQCADTLEYLQTISQEVNKYNMDSCQLAQSLVNGAAQRSAPDWYARVTAAERGHSSDVNAAGGQGPGGQSATATLAEGEPAALREIQPGNTIWRALRDQDVAGWFAGGATTLMQDVMSITGTVVICQPNMDGCPLTASQGNVDAARKPLQYKIVPALVSLSDLVYGVGQEASGSWVIEVLRCDSTSECLNPKPEKLTVVPFRRRVLDLLVGPAGSTTGGIIGKYRNRAGAPSQQELGFLSMSGSYSGMVLSLATVSETAAREFAVEFAPEVAADVLHRMVERMIQATTLAVTQSGRSDPDGETLRLLTLASSRLEADRRRIYESGNAKASMLAYYQQMIDALPPTEVPPRPAAGAP
jgi:conjugative transfer pilus assembly protein TraH